MKSKMKCTLKLIALMLIFTSIGGCTVKQKAHTKQAQTATSSTTKEDKETIKQKQLVYLKEHEEEIVDFVKSKSSKIESVQIYWDETQWIEGGNGTPQGGDEMILIFGGFNQNLESSWRVDVVVEDGKINLKTMSLGQYLRIGGRIFE